MKNMQKWFICVLCVGFLACSDSKQNDVLNNESLQLVEIYPKVKLLYEKRVDGDTQAINDILDSLHKAQITDNAIDDALALISRASLSGYELILPSTLAENPNDFIIISTLPRGIYNLGLIPNAKHFEFALSPTLNEDGSEWNWDADALSREKEDFIALLGDDKNAKIIFYDSGEYVFTPMGSAHLAILWAQHLGYTQLYRLIGGFNAYKGLKLPITTQVPSCCEM